MGFDEATLERFWSKVDKSGGQDACWPWKARKHHTGYGKFLSKKREYRAHRVALTLFCSPLDNYDALHGCDNRPCCNPRHLRWGTNLENVRDKMERHPGWYEKLALARALSGKRGNPDTGVSDDVVRKVRNLLASGMTQTKCAQALGIHRNTVYRIKAGLRHTRVV